MNEFKQRCWELMGIISFNTQTYFVNLNGDGVVGTCMRMYGSGMESFKKVPKNHQLGDLVRYRETL